MGCARGAAQATYLGLGTAAAQQRSLRAEYERANRALRLFDEAADLAEQARRPGSEHLTEQSARHAWRIVREADPSASPTSRPYSA